MDKVMTFPEQTEEKMFKFARVFLEYLISLGSSPFSNSTNTFKGNPFLYLGGFFWGLFWFDLIPICYSHVILINVVAQTS